MNIRGTIIIVNWNTTERTEALLEKLLPTKEFATVVVDNASEKSIQYLEKKFPTVSFIINAQNRGYAAACNQGALKAEGQWLFFLNPDVDIDTIEINACIDEAEKEKLDAASPRVTDSRYQKPLPSLFSLVTEFTPLHYIIPSSMFPIKTLFGGALLIRKNIFLKLKGWDERFFVWFEDADLTKRLYDMGARVGWLSAPVTHVGGVSFERLSKKITFNLYFQSLSIYLKTHHSMLTEYIVETVTHRFWYGYLSPQTHKGLSLIIPNMKKEILDTFLTKNKEILSKIPECIVVSSNLDETSVWKFREKYSSIRFIPIHKNYGFAHTVNIGMRAATGAYIGTCNDDVVLNSTSFSFLKTIPLDAGSINPVIKKLDGTIESAGIKILPKGKAMPIQEISAKDFFPVDATNGAAVVYARKALEKVGIFDELFGSYLEDIDLSLRLSKAGYKNYVFKNSSIIHLQHQTSVSLESYKQWLDVKNWWLVVGKNWSLFTILKNLPAFYLERMRNISGLLKAMHAQHKSSR